MLKLLRKRKRKLFLLYWAYSALGHVGILIGLNSWFNASRSGLVFLLSIFVFYYYLLGLVVLRNILREAMLHVKGVQQAFAEELLALGNSYAVYLRGFLGEMASIGQFGRAELGQEQMATLSVKGRLGYPEYFLYQMLNKEVSLITLHNPDSPLPLPGAHRFLNEPENWQEAIDALLKNAKLIFLYITDFTPGILIELSLLVKSQSFSKTIIIFQGANTHSLRKALASQNIQLPWHTLRYVVYAANTDRRSGEKQLRKSLVTCLQRCEIETSQQGKLLVADAHKIPLQQPIFYFFILILKSFVVPAFWFFITLMFLIKVIYKDIPGPDLPIAGLGIMLFFYYLVMAKVTEDLPTPGDRGSHLRQKSKRTEK